MILPEKKNFMFTTLPSLFIIRPDPSDQPSPLRSSRDGLWLPHGAADGHSIPPPKAEQVLLTLPLGKSWLGLSE